MQTDGDYPVFTINFDQLSPMCDGDLSSDPSSNSDSPSPDSQSGSDYDASTPLVVSRVPVGLVPQQIDGRKIRLPKAIRQTPVGNNLSAGSPGNNQNDTNSTHVSRSRNFDELLQRLKLEEKQRLPFKPTIQPFKFKRDRSVPVHLRTKEVLRQRAQGIAKIQADIVHHEKLERWKMLEASRKMTGNTDGTTGVVTCALMGVSVRRIIIYNLVGR